MYEAPGVQPVFLKQEQAIDYAQCRACFRSGEIRILDSSGAVTRIIAFVRVKQPFKSPFSSKALYIPLNPVARLDELVVAGRKTRAAKRGAVRAKGCSGNHRHLLRVQQAKSKVLFVNAGDLDRWKRVERTARQMALEANFVETPYDEIAAAMILLAHRFHAVFTPLQGLDSAFLADDGSAHHRILVHIHHGFDQSRRAARITNAPAGHRKRLRKAVEKDRALFHARKGGDADVLAVERQFGINLIAQDQQIFFDGELRDGFKLRAIARAASRIARQVQHEQFAARVATRRQRLGGEREIVLRVCRNRDGHAMRERDARMITDVTRLVEHHLVARIHERAESDIQRLAHADGHNEFRPRGGS